MKNPMIKLAAAAVITIAVILGIHFLDRALVSTGWAEICKNVQQSSTISFAVYRELAGTNKLQGRIYEKDGHLVRAEFDYLGLFRPCNAMLMDKQAGRVIWMDTQRKMAWKDTIEQPPAFSSMYDLFKNFRNTPGSSLQELGECQQNKQRLLGFTLSTKDEYLGHMDYTLWIDPNSMLPVRIERQSNSEKEIFKDFIFDKRLDGSLFDFEPEGYQFDQLSTLEKKEAANGMKMANRMKSGIKMDKILKACRQYTKDHHGQWPDNLDELQRYGITSDSRVNPQRIGKIGYVYIKPSPPVTDSTLVLHETYDQWSEGINIGTGIFQVRFIRDEREFKNMLNQ